MEPTQQMFSPIAAAYEDLRTLQPRLVVEIGRPAEDGWIFGIDLANANAGPFHDLLALMGKHLQSSDRRTIAAAFALRYAWAGGIAIGPYAVSGCVPDIRLNNTSYRFGGEHMMFQKAALHRAEGTMLDSAGIMPHPSVQLVSSRSELLHCLRETLLQQAAPVVHALGEWSGFSLKGLWGLFASSWGNQFIGVYGKVADQQAGLECALEFFDADDEVCAMRPDFYPVTYKNVTHIYQRASSCCRFYLRPKKQFCANCPLISQDERVRRNIEWMKRQLD